MPPKLSPYGLSPSGVGHVEAHKIANKRREKNLNAEGAKESRANAAKRNFQVALDSFVEKKLYSGANGTTYIVKVTDSFLKTLGVAMREAGHRVSGEFPAIGSRVVMKVATRKSRQAWTDFVTDNVREAAAHREIVKSDISTCIKIPCSSAFQCAGSHIPAFYLGFMNGGGASASYVTLMGYAGDMTLDEYMRTRLTTAETYANFELAACTLWASGFAHGDLHRKNAMIDPATQKVTIIDLGFAIKLPADLRTKIRDRIGEIVESDDGGSMGQMWADLGVTAYANRIMTTRGISPWYNPDGRALVTLFNILLPADKARLPEVRRALWKCTPRRRPTNANSDTTEEGEIRPGRPPPVARPVARPPPVATNKLSKCRQKCEAQGKFCNPATFRCVKNRPASNARPAANRPAATDTPRNLSAMAKKIKKIPAGGLRKLLEERRAKCRAQGKEYNPTTSRCVAKKASPLAAGIKPCKQDCAALGKRCNPRTGRCIKV